MERKVAQTELDPDEYSLLAKIAEKRGLSIKDALREAAQRWTQEESGIDPADSFFDIALGRRNPQDWGKGSESDSRELDRLIYEGQSAKKKRSKK